MSGFDFIFALFSLLLGLAMAEVLGGFARALKRHARFRAGLCDEVKIGRLVPLLAIFVLLGQLSFWTITYSVRNQLPFNYITLLVITVIVGGYYLLSALVWPDEPGEWPHFDAYYDQHNRTILIGNLALTIAAGVIGNVFKAPQTADQAAFAMTTASLAGVFGIYAALALNIALIFVKGRRKNVAMLATLIVMEVGGFILLLAAGIKAPG